MQPENSRDLDAHRPPPPGADFSCCGASLATHPSKKLHIAPFQPSDPPFSTKIFSSRLSPQHINTEVIAIYQYDILYHNWFAWNDIWVRFVIGSHPAPPSRSGASPNQKTQNQCYINILWVEFPVQQIPSSTWNNSPEFPRTLCQPTLTFQLADPPPLRRHSFTSRFRVVLVVFDMVQPFNCRSAQSALADRCAILYP